MSRAGFFVLIVLAVTLSAAPVFAQRLIAGSNVAVRSDAGTVFDRAPNPGGRVTISSADTELAGFGSYTATAFSAAGYGTLGASAGVEFTNFRARFPRTIGDAGGSADFEDILTIGAPGRDGEVGSGIFTIVLSGSYSGGASEGISAGGGGRFSAFVNGESGVIGNRDASRSLDIPFDFVFGEPFDIEGDLTANVTLRSFGPISGGSGFASAQFGNTAGFTALTVLDADANEIAYSLSSASGEFAFYDPIPEPGTALLVGLGLMGLARRVRPPSV